MMTKEQAKTGDPKLKPSWEVLHNGFHLVLCCCSWFLEPNQNLCDCERTPFGVMVKDGCVCTPRFFFVFFFLKNSGSATLRSGPFFCCDHRCITPCRQKNQPRQNNELVATRNHYGRDKVGLDKTNTPSIFLYMSY